MPDFNQLTHPVEHYIILIRNENVMLDSYLAALYGVETRTLIQAVKRNIDRFPKDFMFQLTSQEVQNLKIQSVLPTSRGGARHLPYAFTEHGVAMLSGVLKSKKAADVNIAIIRTFVRLRQLINSHEELSQKLQTLEAKYDSHFKIVFDAIKQLMRVNPEVCVNGNSQSQISP